MRVDRSAATGRSGLLLALAGLGLAVLAHHAASRSWGSVVHYVPPFRFADGDAVEGPHVTHRVVLVVVDGLRLDRSRQLSGLNVLRARGADFDCTAGVPSYSRPGRATLFTGAWSEIHGATSNRHSGTVGLDNLFRASRRVGGPVAVAGSDIWRGLFGPDLEGALVLESRIEEERGAFPRVEPRMQNFERDAARRLAASDARLTVLDLVVPDYAAHEFGARSRQYARASLDADRTLGLLADGLNLWTTTLVVTADHGHLDGGGHGGSEEDVLEVPLVMAGRGIRPGFAGSARQVDVAPTIAALLGLPIPGGAEGRPLVEAFDTKDENLRGVAARALAQKGAFARQYLQALGVPAALAAVEAEGGGLSAALSALASLDDGMAKAREIRIAEEQGRRLVTAGLAFASLFAIAGFSLRSGGWRGLVVALLSAAGSEGLFRLFAHAGGVQFSISTINHDEDLERYFARVTVLAGVSVLACVTAALWSARRFAPSHGGSTVVAFCGAVGAATVPAVVVALAYWHQGLETTWRIGDLGESFAAIVALARLQALGVVAALVPILAWLSRPGRRSSPPAS